MPLYASTLATLLGAMKFNSVHRIAAQEDVGAKLEKIISNINQMQTTISTLNSAVSVIHLRLAAAMSVTAIAVSGVFSALDGTGFSSAGAVNSTTYLTLGAISNFSD